jgi:phosphatidylinositol-3-phosphatase
VSPLRRVWGLLLATALACGALRTAAAQAPPFRLPPIRYVFVLMLENESYESTFAENSKAPYLAHTLPARGALLRHYYSIGHMSLGNYVALISGQAPNEATQLDCPKFAEFKATATGLDEDGQLPGVGCVYPRSVPTLPDQLEAGALKWKAYMQDMGNNPLREHATCGHVPIGVRDPTQGAQLGDQYASKHNPFVYFHAIIDDQARCDARVVNLTQLGEDLKRAATTPNYVFITPNLCDDGHDDPCVDGRPGGFTAVDLFLRKWVPLIEAAPAFRAAGMLVITFDEAGSTGSVGSSACCDERGLPGARYPPGLSGPGGGRVGAIVLSRFVAPGTVSDQPYNHYALLRTVEGIFSLPYLGYAAGTRLKGFGADVFSAAAPHPPVR